MRKALWLLLSLWAAVQPAQAADEERLREARALLDSMHIDAQLEAMSSAMGKGMMRELGDSAANQRVAEITMSESMAVMKERALQPGGMIDHATNAYAETFTAEELRDMRRFYESPAGQKMLSKAPELMSRVMQQSIGMAREAAPFICARAKARLQAEGFKTEADRMKCAAPAAAAKGAG